MEVLGAQRVAQMIADIEIAAIRSDPIAFKLVQQRWERRGNGAVFLKVSSRRSTLSFQILALFSHNS
jgi:hypothetical protein